MAAKKKADSEPNAEAQQEQRWSGTQRVSYLPAGQGADVKRDDPSLDPELERIRDEEIARMQKVEVRPLGEPTIDPALVEARDAELKRDAERAGVKLSDTAAGKAFAKRKSSADNVEK